MTLPAPRHNKPNFLLKHWSLPLATTDRRHPTALLHYLGWLCLLQGRSMLRQEGVDVGFNCSSLLKVLRSCKLPSQNQKG